MKKWLFLGVVGLALMEYIAWRVFQLSKAGDVSVATVPESISFSPRNQSIESNVSDSQSVQSEGEKSSASNIPAPYSGTGNTNSESFPRPSTEVVNGRTERTIHVGVRQYEWDPQTIRAKKGELVRLIIHNADVKHGLVIPDLGVDQDIPPDGAVVEFVASKVGTFEFFCSVWCGEGHMEMKGEIVIE